MGDVMMDGEIGQFGLWDYVVFTMMLLVSVAIGIFYAFHGRGQTTTQEFLMANRNLSIIPVSISILVSFMSAITIMGLPAEMYTAGTEYFISQLGIILAIIISAKVFVPLLYPLRLTSSFEYLELRFKSRPAKLVGTWIVIVQQIIYMGMASFAPSTALEAVTGFPVWGAIIIVGLVATFYTTLGGIKAVIWTDVFQAGFMFAGVLAIAIEGTRQVGGFKTVWSINSAWDRIHFFNFDVDPTRRHSFWTLVLGGMWQWISMYGCNPAALQRFCSVSSLKKAQITVYLNIAGVIVLITMTCITGIVVFAYYAQLGCDPLTSKKIGNANQIIPYFVMDVLDYPGFPGLFVSCLFSGALSSVSSSLSALAAVTYEDFLKPHLEHKLSESQKTLLTKVLVLVFGAAGTGFAFIAKGLGGHVLQASLSFTGAALGPVLGLFLLGGLFPWANGWGAVVGGIAGLLFPLWISFGAYSIPSSNTKLAFPTAKCFVRNVTMTTSATTLTTTVAPPKLSGIQLIYTVSYLWYSGIGVATVVIVGLIVSFITGPMSMDEIDPKYLIPLFDRLFCCLPASWRKTLRCNRDFPNPEDIRGKDEYSIEIFSDDTKSVTSYDSGTVGSDRETNVDDGRVWSTNL